MIEAKGTITAEDYVRAQRLHLRPRPLFRVLDLLLACLFAFAFVAASWAAHVGGYTGFPLILGVCAAYLALFFFVWLPFQARRMYKQQKTLHVPFTFRLDETGLRIESELGSTVLPWAMLHRWKENKHLFLIYHAANLFTPVPKRLQSPEAALSMRSFLQEHLKAAN